MNSKVVVAALAVVVVAVALAAFFSSTGFVSLPAKEESIRIGWVSPLTGDAADFGSANLDGIQIAVEEINESGGINGKKLLLFAEDNKSSKTQKSHSITN
jgi:branched-chain amino acid transport system substrate-binding protein